MNTVFSISSLRNHDFYHLRYGKGAIVVAVCRENRGESQRAWDEKQRSCKQKTECQKKQIEEKLANLKEGLKQVERVSETAEIAEYKVRANDEINLLKTEYRTLAFTPRAFFSNLQLAKFYTHDIPPQCESSTRFDKVLKIEELGSHLKITLQFSSTPSEPHRYHDKIGVLRRPLDQISYSVIEGVVERIVPIENVTLEVIGKSIPRKIQ